MSFLKISLFKSLNNKGFTLPEVLIAAAIMGGIALVSTQLMQDQANQVIKSKLTSDLAQFRTEVQTLLQNPSHCQANFYNRTAGTSNPTSITTCSITTAGACRGSGAANSKFPVHTASWLQTNTRISERLRVSALSLTIPSVTGVAIGNADLTITVQSRPNMTAAVKTETVFISVPVIISGSTVIGCPRSFNSTIAY
jgi:prepilin-type N-terminal cleavage/methylation domain-containing protein